MNNEIRKLLTFVLNINKKLNLKGLYVDFNISSMCKSIEVRVFKKNSEGKAETVFSDNFYTDWEYGERSLKAAVPRIYNKLNEL